MGDIVYLHRVAKRYPGGHDALSDVTLTLEQGEMAFLTGHSGAGKSTLMKLIALMIVVQTTVQKANWTS